MTELKRSPVQQEGDLGPKQLRWCAERIPSFDDAARRVRQARADTARMRQEHEVTA